jgi:MFS family permease
MILLFTSRIGLGLAEGINFPSIHSITGLWFLDTEISFISTFLLSVNNNLLKGIDIGNLISLLISPLISIYLGWEFIFYISGKINFILRNNRIYLDYYFFYYFFFRSKRKQIYIQKRIRVN